MLERPDSLRDTIVACATAVGGPLAIIRLSGPRAREITSKLAGPNVRPSHTLRPATLRDPQGKVLDAAMVVEMNAPHSFTGEDVVELHVHGGLPVVRSVIETCILHGSRMAGPGEFTLRAFLNGRMDLSQAESVMDIVAEHNYVSSSVAVSQLRGSLGGWLSGLIAELEGVLIDWRAALDFPEYPTGEGMIEDHGPVLRRCLGALETKLEGARLDLHKPRRVVLAGAPNVGKSTLVNALVGAQRVLVDSQPGTTRDSIDVEIDSDGSRWTLCDTAGIRADAAGVEAAGIALSLEQLTTADLVLWLINPDEPVLPGADVLERRPQGLWLVGGKADLASAARRQHIEQLADAASLPLRGWVSGKNLDGVADLKRQLGGGVRLPDDGIVLTKARHVEAIRAAVEHLRLVLAEREHTSLDVLCMELEEAARSLGRVLGRDVDQTTLDGIFSRFCIGK